MYSYVSPVAGCGSDVPFKELTLTQPGKWDSIPESLLINMVPLYLTTKF